ncbi:NAD-dependent epimerase/dehydratase family protein [Acidobacteriota bacterium]
MKIFVTGGTGFIGSHLVDHFLNYKDTEIYALVRDINNLKWLSGLNLIPLKGDLLNLPALPSDIDYVFHIAGSIKAYKMDDYYTVNLQGTASIFQSLISQRILPKKVVYLSSLAASGPSKEGSPVHEDDEPRPVSPYGKSKLDGEIEALKFKERIPIVIPRVGAVYGPRDRSFVPYFKTIKKGILASIGSSKQLISLIYIKDLVQALELCIQKDTESGDIFHIADPQTYSSDEMGIVAAKIMDVKLKKIKFPVPLAYTAAVLFEIIGKITKNPGVFNRQRFQELKQAAWIADSTKAKELLNFTPQYSLQKGIEETINWYLEHDWL